MLAPISARANGSGYTRQLQLLLPASTDDICCPTTDFKDMAVRPTDLVTSKLRGARRVAIKVADMTLSRAAVAMSAAGLVKWLTLLTADRAVVVFEPPASS
jgi:hypothetical protein